MSRFIKRYFVYYRKKKYTIGEADLKYNNFGFRITCFNVTGCIVNNNLNKRKKQLVIHSLITGRGLRKTTLKAKECKNHE